MAPPPPPPRSTPGSPRIAPGPDLASAIPDARALLRNLHRRGLLVTTTPHDAMFRAAFGKMRHARGLLRQLLLPALVRRIAWSTLRLESGIAVDDQDLGEQRMDLVYSARVGRRRVLVYVLAEH